MANFPILDQKDTRSGFGAGLLELGKRDPNVVALCADLTGSLKMDAFAKAFPERFFQMGVAEANMMGVAAGLTIGGKIPFTGTFANFSTGRVYDQVRQSIAYAGKNVKICASHAGLTLGEDGATHQILEDIGLMRMLPGMAELGEDIFLKPVRIGVPEYAGGLADVVRTPRFATALGLLEEARMQRLRGRKVAEQSGSFKETLRRMKEWFLGNF